MAKIVLDNLTKIFSPDTIAVSKLCLTVADGEFLVLLGPSGCGKTTTLRLIAGLETPTEGTISIDNTIVNDIPPQERRLAMVFQHYALYPHMSVYQNLAFALKFTPTNQSKLSQKQIRQKVQQVSNLLKINNLLKCKPRHLSGGQHQRVALGRALIRQPNAFLLDEPLSNLDTALRLQMRTELRRLHRNLEITTIYVTHDQEEALGLADRIAVLHHGIIRQIDSPLNLYHHPTDKFVAGFIGTPPMNFLPGIIRRREAIDNIKHYNTMTNNQSIADSASSAETPLVFAITGKSPQNAHETSRDSWIDLPKSLIPKLLPFLNKSMILGIRPEDLLRSQHFGINIDKEHKDYVYMDVTAVEPLGAYQDVHLYLNSVHPVVARCDTNVQLNVGPRFAVKFNLNRIHVFEPGEKGKNVTLNGMKSRVGE